MSTHLTSSPGIVHDIAQQFRDLAGPVDATLLKRGHIHDTYIVRRLATEGESPPGSRARRFILQKINRAIFGDVTGLMRNIVTVTARLAERLEEGEEVLRVAPALDGEPFVLDREGGAWRAYPYIEDTETFEACDSESRAYEAALASGRFLSRLADLPPSSLVETIPWFHDSTRRFDALDRALASPARERRSVEGELRFAFERRGMASVLVDGLRSGALPSRVTHNDMKINNVLFRRGSPKAVALVDLDTCMAGTALYDFGDLARNVTVAAKEDEEDLSTVRVNLDLYRATVAGFLDGLGGALDPAERALLFVAPRILALTLGVRFLTDYLNGDEYFKISYPDQNLSRARTQFKIVASMEEEEHPMRRLS